MNYTYFGTHAMPTDSADPVKVVFNFVLVRYRICSEEVGTGSTSRGCARTALRALECQLFRAIAMARAVVGRLQRAVPFDL